MAHGHWDGHSWSFSFSVSRSRSPARRLYVLEGQDKGNPNTWVTANLQNWQELDFIPCRVRITGGPVANQTFTISFPHLTGTTPGFEDLYSFVASSNVVFLSAPTLSSPTNADWSYSFTVQVTNSSTATIQFLARLAAGAHLNPGSSLQLSGSPQSMGNLQIAKPAAGPGTPDLAIKKTGPTPGSAGRHHHLHPQPTPTKPPTRPMMPSACRSATSSRPKLPC